MRPATTITWIMSAQILDANGTVLWEYPNFRSRTISHEPMIALQYPDFSEAEANGLEKANIKFKTIEGIRRRFSENGRISCAVKPKRARSTPGSSMT